MNESEVVTLMSCSMSEEEWSKNCDIVKEKCGGYPSFWFPKIILSGLANQITKRWGGDADIHLMVPDKDGNLVEVK